MSNLREAKYKEELFKDLKIECEKCFGFCCVALYFSASEGFPTNKDAGKPCINLKSDFSCAVHKDLRKNGLKGCMAYDCFGAGQKVAEVTYKGQSWQQTPKLSKQMFDVFLVMRQLHEMLWYLTDASTFIQSNIIKDELSTMIKETKELTELDAQLIMKIDIEIHRTKVNTLLRQVNECVAKSVSFDKTASSKNKKSLMLGFNFIGANLTKTNLIGANLAGALLIATNLSHTNLAGANLIGADLRDANIRGADLSNSIFLTQLQINTATGDANTKLPKSLVRPSYWDK